MALYTVEVDWSGYSRGISTYEVEASSEEEAMENWYFGKELFRETIRDDTDSEASSATLNKEEK